MKLKKKITISIDEKVLTKLIHLQADIENKISKENKKIVTVTDQNFFGVLIEQASKTISKEVIYNALKELEE